MDGDQISQSASPELVTPDDYCRWFAQDHAARFILSSSGRICSANAAAEQLIEDGLVHVDGQQRLVLPRLNGRRTQIDLIAAAQRCGSTERRAYQLGPDRWLAAAAQRDSEDPDRIFVSLRDVQLSADLGLDAIADSFGISESERPVLQGLAQALCPKAIARTNNLSVHTVRAHLRSIYGKMGVRSQTETQRILTHIGAIVEST